MSRPRSQLLLAAWLLILAGLAFFVSQQLRLGADLRLFLPEARTPEQRLLLEEIGEGPASRIAIVALTGAPAQRLAEISSSVASALKRSPEFRWVANGEAALDDLPERLWPYRFLLTDTFDHRALDGQFLRTELDQRLQDLSSPAASFIEPVLARDPTLEALKLLERWQPAQEPARQFDVWFTRAGDAALLLVETRAPAFDPQAQAIALNELRAAFDHARGRDAAKLEISGPGAFSVLMQNRTAAEGQRFGVFATIGMILLVLLAYRRVNAVILSALPLASAALAGLFAVSAIFGTVHGITLAFGFTLIGVAQDYPIHLLSHHHAGDSPVASARALWSTLATGVASTCIAYLAFLFSGVPGLAQLATFTIAGLLVAGLTTRFLLPLLVAPNPRDVVTLPWVQRLHAVFERLHLPRGWVAVAVGLLAAALWFAPGPLWQDNLSALTPVPPALLARDQALRRELGTADVRYCLAVTDTDTQGVLRALEALDESLGRLRAEGAIGAFDHAARYLPSEDTQRARQQRLPPASDLQAALTRALTDTPFVPDAFAPFLEDVQQARAAEPLTPEALKGTPLASRLDSLLLQRGEHSIALVTLARVRDPQALLAVAQRAGSSVRLLDLKQATESLVAQQRTYILRSLGVAAVLLIAVVAIALRSANRVLRVLAPMALTTAAIIAILHACGVPLSLFHLISLVLAAGLGLDYALFFEHAADDPVAQRRTLHALMVCSVSTLMVFALLALSSIPVLRAIGVTVGLGVVSNFVLALVITRPQRASAVR
jgi:predicted exporter